MQNIIKTLFFFKVMYKVIAFRK